jgi:hypothetical protein
VRATGAVAAGLVFLVAGCGKGASNGSTSTSGLPQEQQVVGCTTLTTGDVHKLSGFADVTRRDFARLPGRRCGSDFIGSGGIIVVSASEFDGDNATLARLEKSKTAEFGRGAVRLVPSLGPRAFLAARRYLAFRGGDRVVVLESAFGSSDRGLSLTARQLTALGKLAKSRL